MRFGIILSLFLGFALGARPRISSFYAEKGGVCHPGEPVELVMEIANDGAAAADVRIALSIRPFRKSAISRQTWSATVPPKSRKVLRRKLDTPRKPGYYLVKAAPQQGAPAECAFGIVPKIGKRDPFFGLNVNTYNPELYDAYARIGVGTIELGFPFYRFDYAPEESLEEYQKKLAGHPVVKRQLTGFHGKKPFEFVGRLTTEFPRRGYRYDNPTALDYRRAAVERGDKKNLYSYPDERYGHMRTHALALYDLFGGKVKRWVVCGEIDCRVISMTANLASGMKSVEIANAVLGTRTCYDALKSRDKKIKLAGLGISGADYFSSTPPFQISRLILHDTMNHFDAVAANAYTGNYGPVGEITPPESGGLQGFLDGLRNLSQEFGKDGEVFQSERGYHEYHDVPLDGAETEKFADYNMRSLIMAKGTPGVEYYSLYNGVRCGWSHYYPLIAGGRKFIDGTMWIVALKEKSTARRNFWTNIPRYEAVAFATVARKLAFARPFRMNRLKLSHHVFAYLFRREGKIVGAIWTAGKPVTFTFESEKAVEVCNLSGVETIRPAGKIALALTGSPLLLTLDASAAKVRRMFAGAKYEGQEPFSVRMLRVSPGGVILTLRNKLNRNTAVKAGAETFDVKPGGTTVAEVGIPAGAGQLTLECDGEKYARPVPPYEPRRIAFAGKAGIDGDLRKYGKPDITLTSPENVYPRSVIVRESSDVLKYDGKDIEAEIHLAWNDDALYIGARVRDRRHMQRYLAREIWRDDCMQFAVIPDLKAKNLMDGNSFGEGVWNFAAALCKNGPALYRFKSGKRAGAVCDARCVIRRDGLYTVYELALPWRSVGATKPGPGKVLGLNFAFFDNNDPSRKTARHYLVLSEGLAGGEDVYKFKIFTLAAPEK